MEFRPYVGDIVVFRGRSGKWKIEEFYQKSGHIEQHVLLRRGKIQTKRITVRGMRMRARAILCPNTLVQVWPEVKGE